MPTPIPKLALSTDFLMFSVFDKLLNFVNDKITLFQRVTYSQKRRKRGGLPQAKLQKNHNDYKTKKICWYILMLITHHNCLRIYLTLHCLPTCVLSLKLFPVLLQRRSAGGGRCVGIPEAEPEDDLLTAAREDK